jgi:hypothetical protein
MEQRTGDKGQETKNREARQGTEDGKQGTETGDREQWTGNKEQRRETGKRIWETRNSVQFLDPPTPHFWV